MVNPIEKVAMMIKKKILNPDRIRRIHGGFSFIPHRFLSDGFLATLQQKEILLYLFSGARFRPSWTLFLQLRHHLHLAADGLLTSTSTPETA